MPPPVPAGAQSISFGAEEDVKKRVVKKLQKKRHEPQTPTMELPERLKEGDDAGEEDLIPAQGPPMFMNMNQSIFGLIAAAGSRVDFHDRFESSDEESGDDDERHHTQPDGVNDDRPHHGLFLNRKQRRRNDEPDVAKTTVLKKDSSSKSEKHKRKISGHKLLRSLPALPRLPRHKSKKESPKLEPPSEEASDGSEASPSQEQADDTRDDEDGPRLAPVMSRMLEAKAEMSMRPSFDVERRSSDQLTYSDSADSSGTALARRLQDIFEFDHPEAVIEGGFSVSSCRLRALLILGRVSLLVAPERTAPGLHVHHGEAYLFLRLLAQESGLLTLNPLLSAVKTNDANSMRS